MNKREADQSRLSHLPVRPDWLARRTEAALDPDLPIIDPHHHLWDWTSRLPFLPTERSHPFEAILPQTPRYLLDELLADREAEPAGHGAERRVS